MYGILSRYSSMATPGSPDAADRLRRRGLRIALCAILMEPGESAIFCPSRSMPSPVTCAMRRQFAAVPLLPVRHGNDGDAS